MEVEHHRCRLEARAVATAVDTSDRCCFDEPLRGLPACSRRGHTGLSKHLAVSACRCCFASPSSTAAHAAPAGRFIDSRTAGAMQQSGARGATTGYRPKQRSGLAGIEQAPAPPSAEKEGRRTDRSLHSATSDTVSRASGETGVSADFGPETSRRVKAGPRTALRRRVRVPAPEEKQGVRADRDDDVRADGVARPADREEQGRGDRHRDTCVPTSAVICSAFVASRGVWAPRPRSRRLG